MSSRAYNEGKENLLALALSSVTIEVALVMTNTTCGSENDGISADSEFTTLDEHNGSGYARGTLASKTVTKDDANDRGKFDAADVTFTSLGAGSRDVAGVLLLWDDGGTKRPLSYHEYASPRVADGGDFVVQWRADTNILLLQ